MISPVCAYSASVTGETSPDLARASQSAWIEPGSTFSITLSAGGVDGNYQPPHNIVGYWVYINSVSNTYGVAPPINYYPVSNTSAGTTPTSFNIPIPAEYGSSPTSYDSYLSYGFDYNNGYCTSNAGALGYPNYFYIKTGAPPRTSPVVSFTATPLSGPRALNVQFNDTSTAAPTSWNWSFGDGATSALKNPQHTYLSTGLYTINHSATNAIGTNWLNSTNYINVTPPRPVADFNGTPTSGTAPLAVQFTDLSTNSPTSWSWSFGDGGVSTQQNLSHTYSSAGRYNVSLTAANAGGSNLTMKTGYVVVTVAANQVTDVAGRSQHQSDIEEVASKQQLMNYNPTSFVKPSSDTIKTRLPNDKIFFFAGHGAPGYILISDTNPISGYYAKNSTDDYNFDDTSSSYSNMKLAVFFGCHTGETDPIIGNLVDIIVAKGGSCAMGWIGDIAADGSYSYNSAFWSSLQNGESIEHAHSEGLYAAEDDPYCKSLISPSSSPELYKYCLFENLYHKGSGWANPLPEGMTNQLVQNLKLAQSEKLSETTKSGIQSKSYLIQDQQSIRKFSSKLDVSPVF